MRLRSLSLFIKLNLIKNGVIKRINFFLNLCIFLSIFAISATCISVYFEYKINNYEKGINSNNLVVDIASLNLSLIPKNINTLEKYVDEQNKTKDLIEFFYFTKLGGIFSDRDRFYIPVMNLLMFLDKGFTDFKSLSEYANYGEIDIKLTDDLKRIISELEKEFINFKEIRSSILKQHQNFDNFQGGIKVIKDNKFYKDYNKYYSEFLKFSDLQLNFFIKSTAIVRSISDQYKNKNIELRKQITKQSSYASNLVLVVFFLQLFIFIIIQVLEYQTTRKEIDEARKNR